MKSEKQHLIHDLLDEQRDAHRQAVFLAGRRVLRRRRWRRRAVRSLVTMCILGLAASAIHRMQPPRPQFVTAITTAPPAAHGLTDAELLGLFPNTPVALATLENGKKRLIFLRHEDEERFVARLD